MFKLVTSSQIVSDEDWNEITPYEDVSGVSSRAQVPATRVTLPYGLITQEFNNVLAYDTPVVLTAVAPTTVTFESASGTVPVGTWRAGETRPVFLSDILGRHDFLRTAGAFVSSVANALVGESYTYNFRTGGLEGDGSSSTLAAYIPTGSVKRLPSAFQKNATFTGVALKGNGTATLEQYAANGALLGSATVPVSGSAVFLPENYGLNSETDGHLKITMNGSAFNIFTLYGDERYYGGKAATETGRYAAGDVSIYGFSDALITLVNTAAVETKVESTILAPDASVRAAHTWTLPAHGSLSASTRTLLGCKPVGQNCDYNSTVFFEAPTVGTSFAAFVDTYTTDNKLNRPAVATTNAIVTNGPRNSVRFADDPRFEPVVSNPNYTFSVGVEGTPIVRYERLSGDLFKKIEWLVDGKITKTDNVSPGGGNTGLPLTFASKDIGTHTLEVIAYTDDGNELPDARHTITANVKGLVEGTFTLTTYGGANIILPAPYSNNTLDASKLDIEQNDSLTMTAKGQYNGTIGNATKLEIRLSTGWTTTSGSCTVPINSKGAFDTTCTTTLTDVGGNYRYTIIPRTDSGQQAGAIIDAGSVMNGVKAETEIYDLDALLGAGKSKQIAHDKVDELATILSRADTVDTSTGKAYGFAAIKNAFLNLTDGSNTNQELICTRIKDSNVNLYGYTAGQFQYYRTDANGSQVWFSFSTSSEKTVYDLRKLHGLK